MRGGCAATFSYCGTVPTVARNIFILQDAWCVLQEKSFLDPYSLMTDLSTTELSRPSEWMCLPRFANPVGESMIGEALLLRGEGDQN